MSEYIQFRRTYDSLFERGKVTYALFEGKKWTIPNLMLYFEQSEQPVEALVEAHWEGPRPPDKIALCGATYDFIPQSGLIVAQTTTSIRNSRLSWGSIVHPNVTIHDSTVGELTEISNTSTIIDSRIGHGCLVGTNVVISGCSLDDYVELQDGTEVHSSTLEATGRDPKELAYEGARW